MKFGDILLSDAEGTILAHSLTTLDARIKKGTLLAASHIKALEAAGHSTITAATLEPGDVAENEAAARLATALCGPGLRQSGAATGRANLHSTEDGLFLIDHERVTRINMLDERITVATLRPFMSVSPKQLAVTIKIITYAVPDFILEQAIEIAGSSEQMMSVAAFHTRRAALLMTQFAGDDDKLLDKGKTATSERLERFGSTLTNCLTVAHEAGAVAKGMNALARDKPDILLVLGATAIADRSDIIPSALVQAGGKIDQFGMPVDPGNLLLLGTLGGVQVVGVPGCARSPKLNGFDWVLNRIHAGFEITSRDLAHMGVGGLLKEIPSRPQPREIALPRASAADQRKVHALVLAAGQSRRMGPINKLLAPLDGKPLLRHAVDALKASSVDEIYVVTGHEHGKVSAALKDTDVQDVHNPAYATGLSSSLKAGIAALPDDTDAVLVCLGDMPLVGAKGFDAIINAYKAAPPETICIPAFEGKPGNPVLWPRDYFAEIMELEGDVGARSLIGLHGDSVQQIAVPSNAIFIDVDTPDALQNLASDPD